MCIRDSLGIALSEIGNVSERRVERLVNSQLSKLPSFLVKHPGLNSGFMITQYACASLASENKILAHPASVDSIPVSYTHLDVYKRQGGWYTSTYPLSRLYGPCQHCFEIQWTHSPRQDRTGHDPVSYTHLVGLIQLAQSTMTFILQNKKIEDIVRVNRAFNLFLVKVAMIF